MTPTQAVLVRQALRAVTTLVNVVVITRLVSPSDFGHFAMAGAVIAPIAVLRVLGMREVLLNAAEVPEAAYAPLEAYLRQASWLAFALSVLLAGGLYLWAGADSALCALGLIALWPITYRNPLLLVRLERRLQHAELVPQEIAALTLGSVCATGLAFCGWGIWAIVASNLVPELVRSIVLRRGLRTPDATQQLPVDTLRLVHQWMRMGVATGLCQAVQFAANLDKLVIGAVLGTTAVGFLTRPMALITTLQEQFIRPLVQLGQVQVAQHAQREAAFFSALRTACVAGTALALGCLGLAQPLILIAFGATWQPSVTVLAGLSALLWAAPILWVLDLPFLASGRSKPILQVGIISTVGTFALSLAGLYVDGMRGTVIGVGVSAVLLGIPLRLRGQTYSARAAAATIYPSGLAFLLPWGVVVTGHVTTAWAPSVAALGLVGLAALCAWQPDFRQSVHLIARSILPTRRAAAGAAL
jgi:PST family polysaccharide transporter